MAISTDNDDPSFGDPELPDESDMDSTDSVDVDEAETAACRRCGKKVFDGYDECPHCGRKVRAVEFATPKPLWFIAAVIFCLIFVWYFWASRPNQP
jgi:ribosomal protein L37E